MIYMFLSNNPLSGDINSSNLPCSKNYCKNAIRVSNCLDPDWDRSSVGPNLDPNCVQSHQQMTKVATGKERDTTLYGTFHFSPKHSDNIKCQIS